MLIGIILLGNGFTFYHLKIVSSKNSDPLRVPFYYGPPIGVMGGIATMLANAASDLLPSFIYSP